MNQDEDDNAAKSEDPLGALLGRNFGALLTISLYQTRALMELTNAIKSDPNVSESTRIEAEKAAVGVEKMIAEFDKLAASANAASAFKNE